MDQGVISTFKALYTQHIMEQLIEGTDGEGKPTIREFWKKHYNIRKAIKNISDSWEATTQQNMNGVWRKLWPECVHNLVGFP
ncbi:Tigger transposable element-derived protein 1-like 108 [Homarus americanus]|uniref:Tigger transposable element-derived protein 1-like 108 n=1 Tax=Homarus americanus TaxID=6706 RepID=A0A8J5N924_HOMAM|nr:Tigger transposable element-derived protein 1-like 108 [Homarus americanus]